MKVEKHLDLFNKGLGNEEIHDPNNPLRSYVVELTNQGRFITQLDKHFNGNFKAVEHFKEFINQYDDFPYLKTEFRKIGEEETFYESGETLFKINHSNTGKYNGSPDFEGEYTEFYESGQIKLKTAFRKNKRIENVELFYEDGTLRMSVGLQEYKDKGSKYITSQKTLEYNPDGTLKREITLNFIPDKLVKGNNPITNDKVYFHLQTRKLSSLSFADLFEYYASFNRLRRTVDFLIIEYPDGNPTLVLDSRT